MTRKTTLFSSRRILPSSERHANHASTVASDRVFGFKSPPSSRPSLPLVCRSDHSVEKTFVSCFIYSVSITKSFRWSSHGCNAPCALRSLFIPSSKFRLTLNKRWIGAPLEVRKLTYGLTELFKVEKKKV